MNRRWVLAVVCVIVIIVMCDSRKTGERKKKSRKQIDQEKNRYATRREAYFRTASQFEAGNNSKRTPRRGIPILDKKMRKRVNLDLVAVPIGGT